MRNGNQGVLTIPSPFPKQIPVTAWSLVKAWDVLNELETRLPRPRVFRVAVWGTKRARPGDFLYESVFEMCKGFGKEGISTVTGGGPGVMEAANAGTKASGNKRARTFGLRVPITDEEENPHIDTLFHHKTFHSRLHAFVRLSSAFVVFEPGVGTLLEMLLIWQLLKERHLSDVPLILVGENWQGLLDWMDNGMAKNHKPRSTELHTLHHVPTAEDAKLLVFNAREKFAAARRQR